MTMEKSHMMDQKHVHVLYGIVFTVLLFLTMLTPMVCDDFAYSFNFADWTRLETLGQLAESMAVHRESGPNGRILVLGLVSFFSMFPRWIYCVVNALTGVVLVASLNRLIHLSKWRESVPVLVFCCLFISCFTPAFGENYLWLTGAPNYFWTVTSALLYALPFFLDYLEVTPKSEKLSIIICVVQFPIAFFFGTCSEGLSLVFLALTAFLWLLCWIKHKKFRLLHLLWLLTATLGYFYMMSAPATSGLASRPDISVLGYHFRQVSRYAQEYLIWPFLIYSVFFALALAFRVDRKKIILSVLIFLSALAVLASYIFAKYFVLRHLCSPVFLTMLAIALLMTSLTESRKEVFSLVALACVSVLFLLQFPVGVLDIAISRHKQDERVIQIQDALSAGQSSVILENYYPYTSYAVEFVMSSSPELGPNVNIADYYGIKEVYGVDPEPEG